MSDADDELDELLTDVCYCDRNCVCEWHQRLKDGGSRSELIDEITARLASEQLSESLESVCDCDDGHVCTWHRLLVEGASPEDVLMEIEELPDRSADPDYFEDDGD